MQHVGKLPQRAGAKPRTTLTNPHQQVDQNAPPVMQEALFQRAQGLPGVQVRPSMISVKGARAFWLPPALALGPPEAFMIGEEFAHLHPPYDGSLHMRLPFDAIDAVLTQGWGELHPSAPKGYAPGKTVMIFGPRDEAELDVAWQILKRSYDFATGRSEERGGAA